MSSGSEARPTDARSKPARRRLGLRWRLLAGLSLGLLVAAGVLAVYLLLLYREIHATLDGRLWALPSRVYSAPLSLTEGQSMSAARLAACLDRSRYTRVFGSPSAPGQYRLTGATIEVFARAFPLPGAPLPERRLRLIVSGGRLGSIALLPSGRRLPRVQLEPEPIAAFYGQGREERTVLPLSAFPKYLVDAVLAAEDQRFLTHHGVDPLGILRAFVQNLRRREVVQGGSTITQQTVKNLYLTHDRTLARKAKEALMALVLEAGWSKERILEVYLNEIYLGQRGSASVCGFGEASRF